MAWLLENPNIPLSTSDTLSSFDGLSDTDSISEEMDDGNASYNDRSAVSPSFNQRSDFLSNDEYAMYVRDNIALGMMVRCCKTYEEVQEGDIGRVLKIDKEELHDLNVRVSIFFQFMNIKSTNGSFIGVWFIRSTGSIKAVLIG